MPQQPRTLLKAYQSWNYCVGDYERTCRGPWRLYTAEELSDSPSRADGITSQSERRHKWLMITLIQRVGTDLASPMMTMGAAGVLFHRFFAQRSLLRSDKLVAATACFFLAGKIEDTPRSLQRIAENMHRCYCDEFQTMPKEDAEARWKNTAYQENFKAAVLAAERAILFSLGFDFTIYLPHNCLVDYVAPQLQPDIERICAAAQGVDLKAANVQQAAWDVCNESLRSSIVLTHTPLEVAVAAMYFSLKCHQLNQQMTGGLRWYSYWNISEERLEGALHPIIDMYQEVACPVMPVQTGINGLKTVPAVGSPATDMSRTPLQQPSLTPQQQAMQKAQAMLALHQQRQGAASALAPAADLQSGHPSRMQPRLAPPASISTPGIFMPASTGKAQRSIEQRPARHTAEPGTIASSAIPGSEAAASHAAPSLASLKPFDMASSTQPQQTFVHELIETDIL